MTKDNITAMPHFFDRYINLVTNIDLLDALTEGASLETLLPAQTITDLGDYRYAPNKWTAKDIAQHLIDTERIMAYRALRFARNDRAMLPGFDEDNFAKYANASHRIGRCGVCMKNLRANANQPSRCSVVSMRKCCNERGFVLGKPCRYWPLDLCWPGTPFTMPM